MKLLNNLPYNIYEINPSVYMLTQSVPIIKFDFDNIFYIFKESAEKNIEFCSLNVWNKLKSWLGREAENASYNTETAFFECMGYSEKAIEAIEKYFYYVNERILNLITYIDSHKHAS